MKRMLRKKTWDAVYSMCDFMLRQRTCPLRKQLWWLRGTAAGKSMGW